MKVHFASEHLPKNWIGNSFGYRMLIDRVYETLPQCGVEYDDNAPVALHITDSEKFKPVPGKVNVLFTMWESTRLPDERGAVVRNADHLILPSRWCRQAFEPWARGRIYYAPLGCDLDMFTPITRPRKEPFRWLWVGAPNPRKGWEAIGVVWNAFFAGVRGVELYMKTSGAEKRGVERHSNVTFDFRAIDQAELAALYHSAHAFVFPTQGEGYGLTLLEAMATGLPCVTTGYSGLREFADDSVCRMVRYRLQEIGIIGYKGTFPMAWVDPNDLGSAMLQVMQSYSFAARMGVEASRRAQEFTWRRCCEGVASALRAVIVETNTRDDRDRQEATQHGTQFSP